MHKFRQILYSALMTLASTCGAETSLNLASPDKQYHLLIVTEPSPESPDVVRTSFSITDAQGKVMKKVGATEFPVTAVKWHRDAKALIVLEHIARQPVMRLIALDSGEWKMVEVAQFKEPPNYFSLVNVESKESAFVCYYLGRHERKGAFIAYRTEVSTQTSEAELLSSKKVEDDDLGFYKSSVANELHQIEQVVSSGLVQYTTALPDDEPKWFLPRSQNAGDETKSAKTPGDGKPTPAKP